MMPASTQGGPLFVKYCCPQCKGQLEELEAAHFCKGCQRNFPTVLGIPDFRLRSDPYLGIAEDHAKARLLAERFDDLDLRGLVEYYWQLTPDTPAELAQRFVEHALEGRSRGRSWFRRLPEVGGEWSLGSVDSPRGILETRSPSLAARSDSLRFPGESQRTQDSTRPLLELGCRTGESQRTQDFARPVLELGCRSGGLLAAVAETGAAAVGIDLAFRWLIVARKCLDEAGLDAQLCCCDAEHLPFPESSFALVLAESVLEHTARQAPLLAETHRVLQLEGVVRGTTWNRLAPTPEPHVRLWGVGLLPRPWARRYVRWRGKGDYDHVHLLSAFELRRLLRGSPLAHGKIFPAELQPATAERLPLPLRGLVGLYNTVRKWPFVRRVLAWLGPVLEWECVRPTRGTA